MARRTPVVELTANLWILAVPTYIWVLNSYYPDFFYRSLQEDEYLEWATVFAFLAATFVAAVAALRQARSSGKFPWFLVGVGAFCFIVAGEEISWGQRLLNYRPPEYFLANNFQQELNVHNVLDTDLRKLALKTVILGYGVVLAFLGWIKPIRRSLEKLLIESPPFVLVPSFVATYWVYESYPWKFSGEVAELMLGLGFLFALLSTCRRLAGPSGPRAIEAGPWAVPLAWALPLLLGIATSTLSNVAMRGSEENRETARGEIEALRSDFRRSGDSISHCGIHKRIYTYMKDYEQEEVLLERSFAALAAHGLPEQRAVFFLDPWNNPYWIRHKCDRQNGTVRAFVYSFGPNRRRDSSAWEIHADDIGSLIVQRGSVQE